MNKNLAKRLYRYNLFVGFVILRGVRCEDEKTLFNRGLKSVQRVLEAGLEPAQPQWPKDFKSFVSTIPPFEQPFAIFWMNSGAKLGIFFKVSKF